MPDLDTRSRTASISGEELRAPVRENRIDPAHAMANGRDREAVAATEVADTEIEVASLEMVQQLRLQARQLAKHLGEQQADLDRREAELQARLADVEQQQRNGRLWLKDCHEQLAQHERELASREDQLQQRAHQVDQWQAHQNELHCAELKDLEVRKETLLRREAQLDQEEQRANARLCEIDAAARELDDASRAHGELSAEFERRVNAFDARRDAVVDMISRFLEGHPVLAVRPTRQASEAAQFLSANQLPPGGNLDGAIARDQFDELASVLAELSERRKRLSDTETLLTRAQSEVAELHQLLLAERKNFYAERQNMRRRLTDAAQRAEADLAARRETLETASQQLELRHAAIDQMRAELAVAQRDVLENRLAAQELMSRIAGTVPPAELSRQIAHVKSRLLDVFRLQHQELVDERNKLQAVAIEIGQQHERLTAQKHELERWITGRQKEIETDASRLAQHEQELARRHDLLEKQRFDWEHERQEYQREIRRLLAELGQ